MARDNNTKQYEDWYAKLLRLYPKAYQRRFSEPMQQMFHDLCRERSQAGDHMFSFVLKMYADTGIGILKENSKEIIMNSKSPKTKTFIITGAAGILVVIGILFFIMNNRQSSVIPPMSSLEQARELSKGKKSMCLTNNDTAIRGVEADDKYLDDKKEFSSFELTASTGIMDVPAGTNYETTISSYADGQATGAVVYEKDYGKYNYIIKKLPKAGEWEFVSMVACE